MTIYLILFTKPIKDYQKTNDNSIFELMEN